MGCWRSSCTAVIVVAVFFAACSESVNSSQGLDARGESDVAAIHALFTHYDQTLKEGKLEEFMSLLTDDVIMIGPDRPPLVGKEMVWQHVRPLFETLEIDHRVGVEELRLAGDWAYVRATYWFRGEAKDGREVTEDLGNAVYLVERQPDNSWRVAGDCYNTSHPTSY